jgi:hypothetical protein
VVDAKLGNSYTTIENILRRELFMKWLVFNYQ